MELKDALRVAAEKAGWSVTEIAFHAGATEWSARNWLDGKSKPSFDKLQALRKSLPGFGALVDHADHKAASVAG